MIDALIAVAALAALFAVVGLMPLRRGRCGGESCGGEDSCAGCPLERHGRSGGGPRVGSGGGPVGRDGSAERSAGRGSEAKDGPGGIHERGGRF